MSNSQPIPNINIGQVYDQRYADSGRFFRTQYAGASA